MSERAVSERAVSERAVSERAVSERAGAEVPGRFGVDLTLATLVTVFALMEVVASRDSSTVPWIAAVLLALAQAGPVLIRRRRTGTALVALAALAPVQFLVMGSPPTLAWAVLAFAALRGPRPALLRLILSCGLSVVAIAVVWAVGGSGAVSDTAAFVAGLAVSVGVFVLIGAVLGRTARTTAERAERTRRAEERTRLAAALTRERARIADEIGSGVLTGLRRLTARAAAVSAPEVADPALAALHDDARRVLAGMRRVLGALREPPDGAGSPDPADEPDARRTFPAPTRSGVLILAAVAVVAVAFSFVPVVPTGEQRVDRFLELLDLPWTDGPAFAALCVQLVAVLWWRSAPLTALVTATAGAVGAAFLGGTNLFVESTWMVIVYGAAAGAPPRRSGPLTLLYTLAVLATTLIVSPSFVGDGPAGALELAGSYLLVPLLWLAGVLQRGHRRRTEAERSRRLSAGTQDVVERERLRVARELHDVVAHHVSAITVQAGAARTTSDPRLRREALDHIAGSGRRVAAALPELAGLTPDPGEVELSADGVTRLVEPVRGAGVPVRVEVVGEPADVPSDAELFARRIVTEALTNIVRHAGPSDTRVTVSHRPSAVSVQVADAGPVPGHRAGAAGSGLGLVGMRERAELLGGSLEAGAVPDGGWVVRASLPRTQPDAAGLVHEEEARPAISSPPPTRGAPGSS